MKHCGICGQEVNGAAAVCCPECANQAKLIDRALDVAARLAAYGGDCPACIINDLGWEECCGCNLQVGINVVEHDYAARKACESCWKRFFLEEATRPYCRVCACTDRLGCPEGCCWVEPDLCSECADVASRGADGAD